MLSKVNFTSALKAGIVGSVIMTVIMYSLPLVGLPRMDIMAALGSVFPFKISPYVPGFLMHFGIGVILALSYAAFFFAWLPGPSWLKGAVFSLLPWLFAITLLGPSLQLAAQILGAGSSGPANPCALANPCAPKAANPCATKATANPCAQQANNPCTGKPANPYAATNPCSTRAQSANPCAAQTVNPCAPAANPCAPGPTSQAGIPPQVLSLVIHLIYGGVVGALYRPHA